MYNEPDRRSRAQGELRRRLDEGRARARLDQTQLARRAGVGRATVSKALSPRVGVPSVDTVTLLAKLPPTSPRSGCDRKACGRGRFEALLESLDDAGQERVAGELVDLLEVVAASAGSAAVVTGKAVARDGGNAVAGITNSGVGRPGAARAVHTEDAEATGAGSNAVSGIIND